MVKNVTSNNFNLNVSSSTASIPSPAPPLMKESQSFNLQSIPANLQTAGMIQQPLGGFDPSFSSGLVPPAYPVSSASESSTSSSPPSNMLNTQPPAWVLVLDEMLNVFKPQFLNQPKSCRLPSQPPFTPQWPGINQGMPYLPSPPKTPAINIESLVGKVPTQPLLQDTPYGYMLPPPTAYHRMKNPTQQPYHPSPAASPQSGATHNVGPHPPSQPTASMTADPPPTRPQKRKSSTTDETDTNKRQRANSLRPVEGSRNELAIEEPVVKAIAADEKKRRQREKNAIYARIRADAQRKKKVLLELEKERCNGEAKVLATFAEYLVAQLVAGGINIPEFA